MLLIVSVLISVVGTGHMPPSAYVSPATLSSYFARRRQAVEWVAAMQFLRAIPLVVYAATAKPRLRQLGLAAPGPSIVATAGLLAATLQVISALSTWVLSRPETLASIAVGSILPADDARGGSDRRVAPPAMSIPC